MRRRTDIGVRPRPVAGHRPARNLTRAGRVIVEDVTTDGARLCPCGCNDATAAARLPHDPAIEARRDILRGQCVALADRLVAARYSPVDGHEHHPMCIHRLWTRWSASNRFGAARTVIMWRASVTVRQRAPYGTAANLNWAWRIPEPEKVWAVLRHLATEAGVGWDDIPAYAGRVLWYAARIITSSAR